MNKARYRYQHIRLLTATLCVCILFFFITPSILVVNAASGTDIESTVQVASIDNLSITKNNNGQIVIAASIGNIPFIVEGKLYSVYNSIDSNKVYFVETAPNYSLPIYILNIEFEFAAQERNLQKENSALLGCNVMRVAAYANETFYYSEQSFTTTAIIVENTSQISIANESPEMEAIISNSSWFTHVKNQSLEYSGASISVPASSSRSGSSATPIYGSSLSSEDISILNKLNLSDFTQEKFIYGWTSTGGYIIECAEWPAATGNMLTNLLYYEIVRNTPSTSSNSAHLEVELVLDRQYWYLADSNTLEAHFAGTGFRMYDVKLAMACSQKTANQGYDYIYAQTTHLSNSNGSNPAFTIAKSLVMQFDKYGVLSIGDAIFNAFSNNDQISGTTTCAWPNDYNLHYQSVSHGKQANTMLRAVRVDTDGYLINEEGAYLHLGIEIADRDYENTATNVSMTKALNFAFSYNLRSKNAVWSWVGDGDDRGTITYEGSKTYTK